jgi:hypothetical protein
MVLGPVCNRLAFQNLFNQVDTTSWTIQLITQQLISGASGGTESAVHTTAQDRIGLLTFMGIQKGLQQGCLH